MPALEGFVDYRVQKLKVELLTIANLLILKIIIKIAGYPKLKTQHES